ncbi:hypothetical protein BKA66DRAFT_436390 [Pyrenochaeta sp. MPI-SDFR-AT-0127]|nr:hypothetical protein BKA66DRAFT_436390 [Pyrenochaeta sp. MPI-SDFR-AT-0127]
MTLSYLGNSSLQRSYLHPIVTDGPLMIRPVRRLVRRACLPPNSIDSFAKFERYRPWADKCYLACCIAKFQTERSGDLESVVNLYQDRISKYWNLFLLITTGASYHDLEGSPILRIQVEQGNAHNRLQDPKALQEIWSHFLYLKLSVVTPLQRSLIEVDNFLEV